MCVYIYIYMSLFRIYILSSKDLDIWFVGYRSSVSSRMLLGMMFLPRFLHLFHPQPLGFFNWAAECTRTETSSFWATSPFTTATQRAPSSSGKTSTLSCRNRSTKVSLHGLYIRRPRPMAKGSASKEKWDSPALPSCSCYMLSMFFNPCDVPHYFVNTIFNPCCWHMFWQSLYSRRRWRYAPPAPIASAPPPVTATVFGPSEAWPWKAGLGFGIIFSRCRRSWR